MLVESLKDIDMPIGGYVIHLSVRHFPSRGEMLIHYFGIRMKRQKNMRKIDEYYEEEFKGIKKKKNSIDELLAWSYPKIPTDDELIERIKGRQGKTAEIIRMDQPSLITMTKKFLTEYAEETIREEMKGVN